jgi:hypothetical protein
VIDFFKPFCVFLKCPSVKTDGNDEVLGVEQVIAELESILRGWQTIFVLTQCN